MKGLCFDRFGGPEVLFYGDLPEPELQNGGAIVEMEAIELNYADIYRRQGRYHLQGSPPFIAGYEGAGWVVASAGTFSVGQRVAFVDSPFANAERVFVRDEHLIPLPETVSAELAASVLLQGLTAAYLVQDSYLVQRGDWAIVLAAAGGVGQQLAQQIRNRGGRVFGLTSDPRKFEVIRAAGADAVATYAEDWVARARELSPGGVQVVYDSMGSTLRKSLDAVRNGGHVVFYGKADGEPDLVDPRLLMDRSLTLTGGDLWNVLHSSDERRRRARALFDDFAAGHLRVDPPTRFSLSDGAAAHRWLESRVSTGKGILVP